jgi:hypothetical protein
MDDVSVEMGLSNRPERVLAGTSVGGSHSNPYGSDQPVECKMMNPSLSARAALISVLVLCSSTLSAQSAKKLQPFTASGVVLDTKGKPLEGARVRLRADFVYGRAEVTTGADGRYIISDLIKATYRAEAYVERDYAGTTVCQRLAMPKLTDYNSFPVSQGAERNFRWQLTGKIGYTDTYFGATIMVANTYLYAKTAKAVELRLTPTGPLLDGNPGAVIVRPVSFDQPGSYKRVYDLPLGTYKLKAVLIGKDGSRTPIKTATRASDTPQEEAEAVWRSTNNCGFGNYSGVEALGLWLEKPR